MFMECVEISLNKGEKKILIITSTVDPLISEHIGTGGCSDMQNVRICKIMNIIIMNIIIDNNVNVFYLLHYLSIK